MSNMMLDPKKTPNIYLLLGWVSILNEWIDSERNWSNEIYIVLSIDSHVIFFFSWIFTILVLKIHIDFDI